MSYSPIAPDSSSDPAFTLSAACRRALCRPPGGAATVSGDPLPRAVLAALTVFFTLILAMLAPYTGARAQDGIMANGDLAVTGFSGAREIGGQTFIDTDGASLKVYDVSGKGSPNAQVVDAPVKFEALARDIGQVFGVALDNAPNPNIYATSTTAHGLQIVIPDNNADGVPEHVTTGQPGAMFMEGQFGAALGGGPGTIWRIDGTTGEIQKFADITFGGIPNSGPGLGNIVFDPAHFQFYVSDLDTGAVHRLDLAGNVIGVFDHGVDGRQAAGLAAVPMNAGDTMDITSPAFDSTNSDTWGLADARRRVWGLAYYSGRLFYSVVDGSQVWSVGINADGSFAGDARVEINAVPGGMAVSDILFTNDGRMIVAQRGGHLSSKDYTRYHEPKQNGVLRYTRDLDGNWIQEPDEYAIGFPVDHRNAAGGVGLACDGTLWSTGDALRNDPALALQLSAGGPLVVHGLQGNDVNHVRPFNVPPWASWFVDYKDGAGHETEAGHVGDVEVYRDCRGGFSESFPGWYPIPDWVPHDDWTPPGWWPRDPDLDIEKYANECTYYGGDWFICDYTIVVWNSGAADYVGHLHVTDTPPAGAIYLDPPFGSIPWICSQPGGAGADILCDSVNVETLHPGEAETLEITIAVPVGDKDEYIENCAYVDDPFDFWPNEDCDWTELPRPDLDIEKTFLNCVLEGNKQRCYFIVTFENVGGAPYSGPLHFEEHVPAGTIFGGIHAATTPGWWCVGGPPIECTLPDPPGVTLNGPGDVEQILISVLVDFDHENNEYENCVYLGKPTHADDPHAPGNNHSCEPFTVKWPTVECPDGWTEVPPGGAPAGYQVIFVDGLFDSVQCMRPNPEEETPEPVEHECPAGWTEVPPQGAPDGYLVIALDGVNPDGSKWGLMCMKPKPEDSERLSCRPGEIKYLSPRQVPQGWKARKVSNGQQTIYCATRPRPTPAPTCERDEKKFSSLRLVPQGWSSRKVSIGQVTIYCAKPERPTPIPTPTCNHGEKTFSSLRQVPKGWKARKVTNGQQTIYCARAPKVTEPKKPMCIGGKLVMLKSLPPQYRCICPKGEQLVRGRCIKPKPEATPSTPEVKPCPKGWKRVRGKCIKPQADSKPVICKKGWRKVRGKCLPPVPPQSQPQKPDLKRVIPPKRLKRVPPKRLKQVPPKRLKRKSPQNSNPVLKLKPQTMPKFNLQTPSSRLR